MTLGCWILCELQDAGIDTSKHTPYTTRHASASAAMARGMPIDDILALGGWNTPSSFIVHYNLPIARNGLCSRPQDFTEEYQKLMHPTDNYPKWGRKYNANVKAAMTQRRNKNLIIITSSVGGPGVPHFRWAYLVHSTTGTAVIPLLMQCMLSEL